MVIGRVYKIIHTQSNICYVGSTFNILRQRWQEHKNGYNKWLYKKGDCISIYPFFKDYGIENFKMILIKEYEVLDRRHLEIYESLWIFKLKSCNKNNPFEIPLKKHYMKNYRDNNKSHLKQLNKEYNEKNADKIRNHKAKQIICECGTIHSYGVKASHLKSRKHQQFLIDGVVIKYFRSCHKKC